MIYAFAFFSPVINWCQSGRRCRYAFNQQTHTHTHVATLRDFLSARNICLHLAIASFMAKEAELRTKLKKKKKTYKCLARRYALSINIDVDSQTRADSHQRKCSAKIDTETRQTAVDSRHTNGKQLFGAKCERTVSFRAADMLAPKI